MHGSGRDFSFYSRTLTLIDNKRCSLIDSSQLKRQVIWMFLTFRVFMFTSAVSTIRCYLFRYSFSSNYLSLLVSFFFFAFLSPIPIPRDDLIPRPIVHTGFGRMGIDQKSRLEEGYDSKPRVQVLSPITIGFPFCVFILSSLLLAFFFHTCVCVCVR